MELGQSLLVYLIVVVAVILILFRYGLRLSASIVVAMVVGQVVLLFLRPPHDIDSDVESQSSYALYSLIQVVTITTVYIYAILSAFGRDAYRKVTWKSS